MKNLKFLFGPALMIASWMVSSLAFANPTGPSVVSGDASVAGVGTNQVIINQTTPQAILHWQQFNIAPNEVTQFIQPSAQSIALNRIFDANPSQILGQLQANGHVILLNPNGVLFGPDAQVNVNGLIASSLDLNNANFLNGQYQFGVEGGSALRGAVTNQGTIHAGTGGVYLFAPNVGNNGIIRSPEGQILLAAGATVFLSQRPDGNGFLWEVRNPTGEAANLGTLIADGGRVGLSGRTVRQAGLIQANGVREKNGRIELVATDRVDITGSRTVVDRGDLSIRQTNMQVDDNLVAQLSIQDVQNIDLQAEHDITVVTSFFDLTSWSTNSLWTERTFRFQAGNDLTFSNSTLSNQGANFISGIAIKWNVVGVAGKNIFITGSQLKMGNGGGISLDAGADIRLSNPTGLNLSYLWTIDGGDIHLRAGQDLVAPTISDPANEGKYSGIRLGDWTYSNEGFPVVTDRLSRLTIDVGRDFLGGFILSNGQANVQVGRNFGASGNYVNLTLGKGQINVAANEDIYFGLVQDMGIVEDFIGTSILDPNNSVSLTSTMGNIRLNPIPTIITDDANRRNFTAYYPASFRASAPKGKISIESHLTFWPSLTGALNFSALNSIQGEVGGGPAFLNLVNVNPERLRGVDPSIINNLLTSPNLAESASTAAPMPVVFRTEAGDSSSPEDASHDISSIVFHFNTPLLPKEVTIHSGGNLKNFIAEIFVPDGKTATVSAEKDIDMGTVVEQANVPTGIAFFGTGDGRVRAGGNLDLADSNGITLGIPFGNPNSNDSVPRGSLDISVGGDLMMTQSKIYSYNGAPIFIHGLNGLESPVGGSVDVGTNDDSGRVLSSDRGIVTVRGGNISINATDDVNVNASRIATLGGGDIKVASLEGDINAGFGDKDDNVGFIINDTFVIQTPEGPKIETRPRIIFVPGSGIFTYHPSDPNPLSSYPPPPEPVLPPFEFTPEMQRLQREMIKRSILGQDISSLEAKFKLEADLLSKAYQVEVDKAVEAAALRYEEIKGEHRRDWKLGDITLTAKEGSVVVPPAGIRGRKIAIDAKTLDLQGGEVSGDVNVSVVNVVGTGGLTGPVTGNIGSNVVTSISLPSIPSGGATGGASLGGLSGSTGSISAASSGSVSTASSAVATVQEKVVEQARAEEPSAASAEPTASSDDGTETRAEHGREKKPAGKFRSLQIRRGVVIQVEVNDEQP